MSAECMLHHSCAGDNMFATLPLFCKRERYKDDPSATEVTAACHVCLKACVAQFVIRTST